MLLARYDPGAGIGWHRDRDSSTKSSVFPSARLRPCAFANVLLSGFGRANVQLEPRSAYLLSGEVRWDWEHSIVPGDTLRFSITFRSLSEKGRRLAERFEGTVP